MDGRMECHTALLQGEPSRRRFVCVCVCVCVWPLMCGCVGNEFTPASYVLNAEHWKEHSSAAQKLHKPKMLGLGDTQCLLRIPLACFGFVVDCITDLPLLLDRVGKISEVCMLERLVVSQGWWCRVP